MKKKIIVLIFGGAGICLLALLLYQCSQIFTESNSVSAVVQQIIGQGREEIEEQEEMKKIAITFDDGPHPYYTEQLLDGLKKREVKATFFVTGEHAALHPEIIKRMQEDA